MRLAAAYTGLTRWSLYRAMKNGELHAAGRRGRTYVFDRAELDAWLVGANTEPPPAPSPRPKPQRTIRAAPSATSAAIERVRRIARKQGAAR